MKSSGFHTQRIHADLRGAEIWESSYAHIGETQSWKHWAVSLGQGVRGKQGAICPVGRAGQAADSDTSSQALKQRRTLDAQNKQPAASFLSPSQA